MTHPHPFQAAPCPPAVRTARSNPAQRHAERTPLLGMLLMGWALLATSPVHANSGLATVAAPSRSLPPSLPGLPGISAQNAPVQTAGTRSGRCARPTVGSVIPQPVHIYSSNGILSVHLDYYTDLNADGNATFCFVDVNGNQAPVLHGKPGDTFNIEITNHVPPIYPNDPAGADARLQAGIPGVDQCGERYQLAMDPSSVNAHFHGFLVTPRCQSDNVVHTVIAAGDTFEYSFPIPANEPPGLYWFHPHVHGSGEQAVLGGASGELIIDGLEQFHASVAGLPQRVLVLRDQQINAAAPQSTVPYGTVPTWDVSLNYVPVLYTGTPTTRAFSAPGILQMQAGTRELWRVVNAGADAILDFQVLYDGVPQALSVVALDGVPVNVENDASGAQQSRALTRTTIAMAPGQRAEFIITPPAASVRMAVMQLINVDTGLVGDVDPARTIAVIQTRNTPTGLPKLPTLDPRSPSGAWPQRFSGMTSATVTAKRTLYFNEVLSNPADPNAATNFFITVDGAKDTLYAPGIPPAITTRVGAVELWTIQNRALEAHVFHIHQIHYLMQSVNGVRLPESEQQLRDDYTLPGWNPPVTTGVIQATGILTPNSPYDPASGLLFANMNATQRTAFLNRYPYPSFSAKFDFRDPTAAGDFVYHCHILAHEDQGMMALIRVLP